MEKTHRFSIRDFLGCINKSHMSYIYCFLYNAPATVFIQKHENKHNLCVYTLSTPFLIWAAFHYGVTFEWHSACCHSHVLRFPLISSTKHNNDYFSPSVCVIVAGCHAPVLTFAMLSAGLCKYKHIFLSYWPLSPHFLDSHLQLLTIQTLWMKHNLSIQSTLSCFLSPQPTHPPMPDLSVSVSRFTCNLFK